ncbi:MAG: biliverdin-producing heme oxygenase [Pseudomonadota bacterium]
MTSLRSFLKRSTEEAHNSVHEIPLFKRFANAELSRTEYQQMMERYFQYFQGLDPAIVTAAQAYIPNHIDYVYTPRADLMRADLSELGLSDCAVAALSPCQQQPDIGDIASLVGVVYVIEGSVIGGRQLSHAAEKILAAGAGDAYWRWCRHSGLSCWKKALEVIDLADDGEACRNSAVKAARETFYSFASWFSHEERQLPKLVNA